MRGRNAVCVAIPSYHYDYLYNGDRNASPSRLQLPSEILVSILLYLFFKPTKGCRDFSLLCAERTTLQSSVFILIPNTIFLSGNLLFYIKLCLFLLLMCFILSSPIPTLFMLCVPFHLRLYRSLLFSPRCFICSVVFCHAEYNIAKELFIYFQQL